MLKANVFDDFGFAGACDDCDSVFTLCLKTELQKLPFGWQPEMWRLNFVMAVAQGALRLEARTPDYGFRTSTLH